MREWAFLEAKLDELIATALEISILESWAISTTIPVSSKWNISQTLIDISQMSLDDKHGFKGLQKEFNNLVADRNVVAHCMFYALEEENVVAFVRIANKGSLLISGNKYIIRWSEERFNHRLERINQLRENLITFEEKLKDSMKFPAPSLEEILSRIAARQP